MYSIPEMHSNQENVERSILSCILLDNSCFDRIELKEEWFYFEDYKKLYKAIVKSLNKNDKADYITVLPYLCDSDVGALSIDSKILITDLYDSLVSTENYDSYVRELIELNKIRRIRFLPEFIAKNLLKTPDDFISNLLLEIESISNSSKKSKLVSFKDIITPFFNELFIKKHSDDNNGEYIETMYKNLDSKLCGLWPGQLIIVAARPSMGKSTFMVNLAYNFCFFNYPVIIYSLEMNMKSIYTKILSLVSGVNPRNRNNSTFTQHELKNLGKAQEMIEKLPIFINDQRDTTVKDIDIELNKIKYAYGKIGVVLIDYLQIVKVYNKKSREEDIGEIAEELKSISKKYECPIIALAQLNRSVDSRPDKKPFMSDLRDSGRIEQEADVIMMLYRDEYYFPETSKYKNKLEVIIAKNREGETGSALLNCNLNISRIYEDDGFDKKEYEEI